ncbi:hypothetical protein CAC42_3428 [Sphaceloma murrayae]|uniref:Uncharacterized protein n=1 Tax=Sphaceloma murrayae TaxID=2082308 RepID=A0A2K1R1G2_9PEZI|nr:hypothetical protein CAC42_3428 [Sphaceloma murrayae]
MGGHAFDTAGTSGEPAVAIARLTVDQYKDVASHTEQILRRFFDEVRILQGAPEKLDHGDVDFLVRSRHQSLNATALKTALSAVSYRVCGPISNFAVPFADSSGDVKHAQVDVQQCGANIAWLSCLQSYGDLWQILGTITRPFGLTVNDKGLFLRIKEGEARDWQASMIALSESPEAVISFFGMDWMVYEAGFTTLDQVFKWISSCRLLDVNAFGDTATEHRKRNIDTRPMFRRFMDGYIPTLQARETVLSRDDVLQEALQYFDKHAEYESRHDNIMAENLDLEANALIVDALKPPGEVSKNFNKNVNLAVRAIKRWTKLQDGEMKLRVEPELEAVQQLKLRELLSEERGRLKEEHVRWIKEHFDDLRSVEKQRIKEAKDARQGSGSQVGS